MTKERDIEDLIAGNAFRETLVPRADQMRAGCPLWHGWAIMDAFLAGVDYARSSSSRPKAGSPNN